MNECESGVVRRADRVGLVPSLIRPTPTKSGTSPSKWARKSAVGSICSSFHTLVGPPDSITTVSCTTNRLRFWSQTAPFVASVLQTYLIEYHLRPRFQEM